MLKFFFKLSLIAIFLIFIPFAYAETMSNSQYKLKLGNFNTSSAELEGSGSKLNYSLGGQNAFGTYKGDNYTVISGFPNFSTASIFSFSVSPILIDFGTITPTNPVTRTNTLTVSNGSSNGYTVSVSEDHPLRSSSNNVIPDTSCDDGSCASNKTALWTNTLTYGFGYRCDPLTGADCDTSFVTQNYFKPFSSASALVLSGTGTANNKQSQITYKVNIAGSQELGTYTNTITFLAVPNF